MSAVKKAIKSIGRKIQDGDAEGALRLSTEALKEVKEDSPDLPELSVVTTSKRGGLWKLTFSRLMFRGLAYQHLRQPGETEKVRDASPSR